MIQLFLFWKWGFSLLLFKKLFAVLLDQRGKPYMKKIQVCNNSFGIRPDCAYILILHLIIFPREGISHAFKEVFFTKCWIKNEAKQQCPEDGSVVGKNLTLCWLFDSVHFSGFYILLCSASPHSVIAESIPQMLAYFWIWLLGRKTACGNSSLQHRLQVPPSPYNPIICNVIS